MIVLDFLNEEDDYISFMENDQVIAFNVNDSNNRISVQIYFEKTSSVDMGAFLSFAERIEKAANRLKGIQ